MCVIWKFKYLFPRKIASSMKHCFGDYQMNLEDIIFSELFLKTKWQLDVEVCDQLTVLEVLQEPWNARIQQCVIFADNYQSYFCRKFKSYLHDSIHIFADNLYHVTKIVCKCRNLSKIYLTLRGFCNPVVLQV